MAVTFEELIGSVRTVGAQQAKRDVDDVRKSFKSLGDVIQELGTLGGMAFLIGQVKDLMGTLAEISGFNVATRFMGIARALEAITGSTDKANRMLEKFKTLGRQSAFDTADVGEMGAKMLGSGVSEDRLIPELTALLDLASHGMGVSRGDMPEFMRNLLQIRGRTTGKADLQDINQMKDRVPQIGRFLSAGMGGKLSPEEAIQKAQSLTGRELYNTIIRGAEAMAKGAAAAKALADPMARIGNLMESLGMSMEPTGRIIAPLVMKITEFAQALADAWGWVNKWTGGLAGLGAIIGGGLWLGTRTLTSSLYQLTTALFATAGAARTAAASTGSAAAASWVASSNAYLGLGGGAAAGGAAALMPRLLGGGLIAGIIATVSGAIGDQISGDGSNTWRRRLGNAFQPFGGFRNIKDLWDTGFSGNQKPSGGNPVVDELKKVNSNLKELKFSPMGGGARSARAISDFEAYDALAKIMAI